MTDFLYILLLTFTCALAQPPIQQVNPRPMQAVVNSAPTVAPKSVAQAFIQSRLVPDLIPVPPQHAAQVVWSNGAVMNLGNQLQPAQTAELPAVISWPREPFALYTILLIDALEPGNKEMGYHYGVMNVPGLDISTGNTVSQYAPIAPGPREPPARFALLVFKQLGGRIAASRLPTYLSDTDLLPRFNFNMAQFTARYQLGNPVAGNYYMAQCDAFARWNRIRMGIPDPGPC